MSTRLVQLTDGLNRRVAVVDEPRLRLLTDFEFTFALARDCMSQGTSLSRRVEELARGETLSYDDIYTGRSPWHLLPPIDIPGAPERVLISGTGLTHLGSAKDRQAMHLKTAHDPARPITDSMRMFESGLDGGRPAPGRIGIAPEWFYKGNGGILQAPFAPLPVPSHAEDGGEEAEIAGIYLIADDGTPVRLGMCAGNEFADHKFERRNYLNLAGSKLRACALGPELVLNAPFHDVKGSVRIERNGATLWQRALESGENNMAHSLRNLEHHHFKFEGHRTPDHVHIHFFGAHSLSFGEGIELREGDIMQVQFDGYGRPLRNPVTIEDKAANTLVIVRLVD